MSPAVNGYRIGNKKSVGHGNCQAVFSVKEELTFEVEQSAAGVGGGIMDGGPGVPDLVDCIGFVCWHDNG